MAKHTLRSFSTTIFISLATLLGSGCASDYEKGTDTGDEAATACDEADDDGLDDPGLEDPDDGQPEPLEIITEGMAFAPASIIVAVGEPVSFSLSTSHNAVEVDEATWEGNGSTPLEGGFSVELGGSAVLTFDEPGTYFYVCTPHASMGMKGVITVVE